MSLAHAMLGILHQAPMTGYDLKTRYFDRSIRYFWPADQAQIYRTLDKMEERGWVESAIEFQEGRPNRKVYHITDTGRAELDRWLHEPDRFVTYRDPFLIQIFFAGQLSDEPVLQLLEQHLQKHQALLAEYQQIPLPPLDQLRDQREHTMARLTLEFGLRYQQMYVDWLRLAMETVGRLEG